MSYSPDFRRHKHAPWAAFVTVFVMLARGAGFLAADDTLPAEDLQFFERHIRPVLVERCYECHADSESPDGGLRVDSRDGLLAGGDTGPAVVPGDPTSSRLMSAIRYDDPHLQMPPDGRLPEKTIEHFEQWIRRGAPDPRRADTPVREKVSELDLDSARQHWAYQLPAPYPVPHVQDEEWTNSPVDRFILAELEARQLEPVGDASRETLLRRAYFDLIGLAPSPEEIDAFLADDSPDAFERVVDRLLASPRFGERWGRHWLDVVRFGESLTLRGLVLPEAWRYRDYVIDAFNADRSVQQMLVEQIAGDLLPARDAVQAQRQTIATTFLALGNTNLEEQDKQQLEMDYIDEQLDVIGQALLGQTIGCARCHDHKFDPIPTRDYYALAKILRGTQALEHANVSKWIEIPLPLPPEQQQRMEAHERQLAALDKRLSAARQTLSELDKSGSPVAPLDAFPGIVLDDSQAIAVGQWQKSQSSGRYIGDGYIHDQNTGQGEKTLTFQPESLEPGVYEVRVAYSDSSNRATNVRVTVFSADGETTRQINQREAPPILGHFVSLGQFRFERDGQAFVMISNEEADGYVIADAVQFLPISELETSQSTVDSAKLAEARTLVKQLEAERKALLAAAPPRPRSLGLRETGTVPEMRIHLRGSVHTLGEPVERGFLQVANYEPLPEMPTEASGRVQLAEWIASERNPLTARVFVNRAWHWLFGAGLVRTTNNFGTTGEPPSHPELLDYLTRQFMADGWSTKKLVRTLVLTRTYRLASAASDSLVEADPENRLFGRAFRKRLDAESLRDAMLQLAGTIDWTMGGSTLAPGMTADFDFQYTGRRRSVYVPVLRNSLPDIFEVFDFADPSMPTGRRNQTNTVPQALFLMNSEFVQQQARDAAERLLACPSRDDGERLERLFREALGRAPSAAEQAACRELLSGFADNPVAGWTQLIHGVIASIDFRYVD